MTINESKPFPSIVVTFAWQKGTQNNLTTRNVLKKEDICIHYERFSMQKCPSNFLSSWPLVWKTGRRIFKKQVENDGKNSI